MTPDFDAIADKLVSVWPDAESLHNGIRAALHDAWNAALETAVNCGATPTLAKAVRAKKLPTGGQ